MVSQRRRRAGNKPRKKKNYCFACGPDNRRGMQLKFRLDAKRQSSICCFRLDRRYTGPPGYCHGGIIATILNDAMSKLSKLDGISAATSRLTIEYLKPVPLGQPLRVESRQTTRRGRRLVRAAEILDGNGRVLARSRGVFVRIDPARVFPGAT